MGTINGNACGIIGNCVQADGAIIFCDNFKRLPASPCKEDSWCLTNHCHFHECMPAARGKYCEDRKWCDNTQDYCYTTRGDRKSFTCQAKGKRLSHCAVELDM